MVKLALAKVDEFPHHGTYSWRITSLKNTAIEMGRPILFSKVIIILAFLPIFTFQRVEGKIFSPMAFTLSFALLGSILLTLTFVPALMSYLMRRTDMAEKHSDWMHAIQEAYRKILLKVANMRFVVIAASIGLLVSSIALSPLLGSEFLPKLDEGNIWHKRRMTQRALKAVQANPADNRIVCHLAPGTRGCRHGNERNLPPVMRHETLLSLNEPFNRLVIRQHC